MEMPCHQDDGRVGLAEKQMHLPWLRSGIPTFVPVVWMDSQVNAT